MTSSFFHCGESVIIPLVCAGKWPSAVRTQGACESKGYAQIYMLTYTGGANGISMVAGMTVTWRSHGQRTVMAVANASLCVPCLLPTNSSAEIPVGLSNFTSFGSGSGGGTLAALSLG